jgi:hypothetical protein
MWQETGKCISREPRFSAIFRDTYQRIVIMRAALVATRQTNINMFETNLATLEAIQATCELDVVMLQKKSCYV